jgi:hypothetical protein
MKQHFKQTQQHADYGAGVMETGDHFKNGASPKSLTSRRNFLLMPDAGDRRKTKSIMNGTMNDGATTFTVGYKISGNSLDLTFNRSAFEAILGTLPDDYYDFDEVEFILSFNNRAD